MIRNPTDAIRTPRQRGLAFLIPILLGIIVAPVAAAGGLGFGIPIYTINVLPALVEVPTVVSGATQAWEAALIAEGFPPEVAEELSAEIEAVGDEIAASIPLWTTGPSGILLQAVPIPHLGGLLAFDLPFVILDTLRIEAGWLSERLLFAMLDLAHVDVGFDSYPILIDWDDVSLQAAPEIRSWILSTEVTKQIGLLIGEIELGVGFSMMAGRVASGITILGGSLQEAAGVLISELQLESLQWTMFAVQGSIGFGLGPPFFRLVARVTGTVPISQSVTGGWSIALGEIGASLGMVIRF